MSFQPDAMIRHSDWLIRDQDPPPCGFDWMIAQSSKHQFENLSKLKLYVEFIASSYDENYSN